MPDDDFKDLVQAMDVRIELENRDGDLWIKAECIVDFSLLMPLSVADRPRLKEEPINNLRLPSYFLMAYFRVRELV